MYIDRDITYICSHQVGKARDIMYLYIVRNITYIRQGYHVKCKYPEVSHIHGQGYHVYYQGDHTYIARDIIHIAII